MTPDAAGAVETGAPLPRLPHSTTPRRLRRLTVASIPSAHVYLSHLSALDGTGPLWLPHPLPEGAPNRYGTRWPPVALPLEWLRQAAFDVLHVQFDFDVYTVAQLEEIVDIVRRHGIPLIFTVHDLRPTTCEALDDHEQRVDVLVRAADALITLTPGAAEEIKTRWGRHAVVVPHPHVVDFETMERVRAIRAERQRSEWHLGVHLRWLRANMDLGAVPVLAEAMRDLPGAVLDVFIHADRLDAPQWSPFTAYLRDAAEAGDLRLHPHAEMTNPQLWESLADLDAAVLPYRFGTHSGWLEACRDLGVTVIAPACGYYVEQGPVVAYTTDENGAAADSLAAAVRTAYRDRPDSGVTVAERMRQRQEIAAAHERLYRSLLSERGDASPQPSTA